MIATLQAAVLDSKTEANQIPENVHLRESSTSGEQENGHILEVAFSPSTTRFRESSVKPPRRVPNAERRSREFLTPTEVESLINAAEKLGRHGHRDATMLMVAYRHALRVSELVSLRWDQVDFPQALLHVKRLKNGNPSTHPLHGPELRALRKLQRDYPNSPYVFVGERNGPLTASSVRKIVARAGVAATIKFPVHPHQLRHGCGYRLASAGVDTRAIQCYLGHRNITHTTRYTELSPERFKDFWRD
jgi:type 1 fimbriae regulatory protein FimB/type 1 fimbriae regulatory protein FimE